MQLILLFLFQNLCLAVHYEIFVLVFSFFFAHNFKMLRQTTPKRDDIILIVIKM